MKKRKWDDAVLERITAPDGTFFINLSQSGVHPMIAVGMGELGALIIEKVPGKSKRNILVNLERVIAWHKKEQKHRPIDKQPLYDKLIARFEHALTAPLSELNSE